MTFTQRITNRSFWTQHTLLASMAAIALVFSVDFSLRHTVANYIPLSLFLSSVVIATWLGGTKSGLVATAIGAILEVGILESPRNFLGQTDLIRLVVYLIQGGVFSFIFGDFYKYQGGIQTSERELAIALNREKAARQIMGKAVHRLRINHKNLDKQREVATNASRVKTLFLAHMSHEIRTPLVSILGFADLLKDPELLPSERLNYVNIIERTGNNLKDIIDDILDMSKIETDHFEIDRVSFSLSDLLREIEALLTMKCAEKNIELKLVSEGLMPTHFMSDPRRLKQILMNLIGNAIKFTDKGFIRLKYRYEGDELIFRIHDSGRGITEEYKNRLFENFSQGDDSVSRQYSGTGLGLALSRGLARMLGGDVRLLWSRLNRGSVFEVRIKAAIGMRPVREIGSEQSAKFDGKRVLVVDDCSDNRLLLERALGKMGFTVTLATNGVEAISKTESESFDLILMDMQMPVMDGYAAAHELRERHCPTPVIALTAHALRDDRRKCLEAGCNDYISKPLQKDQLYQVLAAHC